MAAKSSESSLSDADMRRAAAIGAPIVRELNAMYARLGISSDDVDAIANSASLMGAGTTSAGTTSAGTTSAGTISATSLTTDSSRSTTSYTLGRTGEADVIAAIRSVWPAAINVAQKPHTGDIMLRTADGRVIIEVKNYKTRIPQPQIDKFHADIKATDAAAGIFISLHSPITGILAEGPMNITYEHFGRFVPVIYLTQPKANEITIACQIVTQLLGAISYANTIVRAREEIYSLVAEIANVADNLSVARARFGAMIGNVTTQLADVAGDFRLVENSLRDYSDIAVRALTIEISDVDLGSQIFNDAKYINYSIELKNAIRKIVDHVNSKTPSVKGGWTTRGKKYAHTFTGVAITLLVRSANVTLGRESISTDHIMQLLTNHAEHTSVKNGAVTVDVTCDIAQLVCEML